MGSTREKLLSHEGTLKHLLQDLREISSALAAERKKTDSGSGSGRGATKFLAVAKVEENLSSFYQAHNPQRVEDVPKILTHFEGRFHALNEALVVSFELAQHSTKTYIFHFRHKI